MHTNNVDLNLLKVFVALMRTRSVTLAAEQLELSQSATSHALQRLREIMKDRLFVPSSRGMQPTPFALEKGEHLSQAFDTIQKCLERTSVFDPATTTRQFTLFVSDIGNAVFMPKLLNHFKQHAPLAGLNVISRSFKDVGRELETGEVDIAVSVAPVLGPMFYQQTLFKDNYVCIVRSGHPLAGSKMTLHRFNQSQHLVVDTAGTGHQHIDEHLNKSGLGSNIKLRVPHFLSAPIIVMNSDLVASVPARLAQGAKAYYDIQILEHPMRLPSFSVKQFWHKRLHDDASHQWLRNLMVNLFKD